MPGSTARSCWTAPSTRPAGWHPGWRFPASCARAMRARELLDAADDADVLVLGTHNPAAGAGNTVSAVLHKARCNVLVTR